MSLKVKRKLQPILFFLTALMLFTAVGNWPYQFYIASRIVISAASIYAAVLGYNHRKKYAVLTFLIIAVLYNPLYPISLHRRLWIAIDIISGVLFIVSIFVLRKSGKLEISENKKVRKAFFLRRRFLIPAFIGILVIIFIGRQAWIAINGNEQLSGVQKEIPSPTGIIPPLETGQADWPCWRGPNGDGKSADTGIIKDWSGGLKKLWEVNYLCQGKTNVSWSSVAVSGNRLVVPGRSDDSDLVFCMNSQNGELIWFGSYKAKTGSSHGPGSRATPCIDEDRVYTFGRSGDLACWSLEDGNLLWRKNVENAGGKAPIWGHSSSPLVYQDKVIVQAGGDAFAIAYDKITGNIIWKSKKGKAGYAAITSMEIEGSSKILVFHGTGLSCLDPNDGRELWFVEWKTSSGVNATTPAVSGSTIFITSGYNTGCQALRISQASADSLWTNKIIASHHSDPIIIDGFIYGYSGLSNQNKGYFKCVELETGKEMWSTDKIGWGTTTCVDGHLICMDIDGNLFMVKPEPDEFKLVTEIKNALGEVDDFAWTIPVAANGKLYLRYMQRLICYDIMP